jgi:hypothetical protein
MFFHANKNKADCLPPPLCLNHTSINFSTCVKYLGFMLDEKLNWKYHIANVNSKLRKWVGIFWRVGPLLNKQTKHIVYASLFHSILAYGIELYGNAKPIHLKKVKILQNKALKALFNLDRKYPTKELYQKLNILSFNSTFQINSSVMLWKLIKLPVEVNAYKLFSNKDSMITHKYETREKNKFNLMFQRPSYTTSNTFKLHLLWNNLPANIKEIDSFILYKCGIQSLFTE